MEICLLGSLAVLGDDGRQIALPGTRLQRLLTALALRCGESVSDGTLFDAIWGDDVPARSPNALQRQVSTLRRALGGGDVVQRRGVGYALSIEKSAVDICVFDARTTQGLEAMRNGDLIAACDLLTAALGLWRGDALADFAYDEFAQLEIARLTEARLVATEARVDVELALGHESQLIAELEQLVIAHPLREHFRAQLMTAMARSGRQADALRSYGSFRRVLAEELGLEPSQVLRDLEAAILRQEEVVVPREAGDSPQETRTNLRTPLTSLVGRSAELGALRVLLGEERIVTLVGPGGVGKSRLAVDAARDCLSAGSRDVWMVELAEVADPIEVLPAIMAVVGLSRSADSDTDLQRVVERLSARPTLLVLDNCEHVIASAAKVSQDLLESCATLRILATSREGLAIPSEICWPVSPLELDQAVFLFVERARAADPMTDLGVDAVGTSGLLHDVCIRLDGLPLAIELAAARLRSMPIAELAAGLEDRFRLLSRGARNALPRQQTMRAVVDWSYELLFDDERRVFEWLSVFGGGCALAAARVVCAGDGVTRDDVDDLVTRLAEKSLVTVERDEFEGYARCRMLQTLVDYGRERLESSGQAAHVYAAHARYYTDFACRSVAALRGENQLGWLRAATANMGNLRSAFDVAIADGDGESAQTIAGCMGWYWWFTGRAIEGSHWLRQSRACEGPVEPVTGARVMAWTAFIRAPGYVQWVEPDGQVQSARAPSTRTSRDEEIDQMCAHALTLYRDNGALAELAAVEIALSVAYSTRGLHHRVRELLGDAAEILSSLEPTASVAALRMFITARHAFVEDRFPEADDAFRASTELFDACRAPVYSAFALRYIGRIADIRGDPEAGLAAIERALDLARSVGLLGFVNVLTTDLGFAVAAIGDFERARTLLAVPLAEARETGFLPGVAESLAALALVEWRAANDTIAARIASEALDCAERAGDLEAIVHSHAILGSLAERAGKLDEARVHHVRALAVAHESVEPRPIALALEGLASVAIRERDGAEAARLLGAASVLRQSPGIAAGSSVAASVLVDATELFRSAAEATGPEAASHLVAEGASDPAAVVTSLLSGTAATMNQA